MEINEIGNLIPVQWLYANRKASNLVILDATINKMIDASSLRIPKARFFDIKQRFSDTSAPFPSTLPAVAQFETEAQNLGINNDSCIVVYDDKGIYSSARVWWMFKVFGFNNVAVLDGGLPEWKSFGFPVENYTTANFVKGNFKARFNASLITDFKGVKQHSEDDKSLILDARSAARFKCEVDEPREGLRRGTIPNSENLPYTDLLDGNTLKPVAELSEIFSNLEVENRTMVFSCGSGITASILALASTLCNYDKLKVYDGSWTEYGSLTN